MARAVTLAAWIALFVASTLAEECPLRSSYNGCLKNGCLNLESGPRGRQAVMVCNECGKGYVLVEKGTRNAKCGES
jgi:transposase-like protein